MDLSKKLYAGVMVLVWFVVLSLLLLALLAGLSLLVRPQALMAWLAAATGVVCVALEFKWNFLPKLKSDWDYFFNT